MDDGADTAARAAARIAAAAPGLGPSVAIVLGSGLGALADALDDAVTVSYAELPGFPVPSVASHAGALVLGRLSGVPVACLKGRAHYYEGKGAGVMATPIRALQAAGCTTLVLTNAAGSLRAEAAAGSLMLITDHINFAGANPLLGAPGDNFVDLGDAYDPALRAVLLAAAKSKGITLHQGVYMWFAGPSFETPAEIRAAKVLGADAVGMSTVPECILARRCGLRVATISNITNLAAGMTDEKLSHDLTMAQAVAGGEKLNSLLRAALPDLVAA